MSDTLERLRERFDTAERHFHEREEAAALAEWTLENGETLLDIAEAAQRFTERLTTGTQKGEEWDVSPATTEWLALLTKLASLDSTAEGLAATHSDSEESG